ncbi:MAG: hypothetical protein ABIH42_04800 [Planctomycetota bacterium]
MKTPHLIAIAMVSVVILLSIYMLTANNTASAVALSPQYLPPNSNNRESLSEEAAIQTNDLHKWVEKQLKNIEIRIEKLETTTAKLTKNVEKLDNTIKTNRPVSAHESVTPAELIPHEIIRSEIEDAIAQREQERREQIREDAQQRFSNMVQRQIDRAAEQYSWDDQKKQEVITLIDTHRAEVQKIIETARQQEQGEPTPEERDKLMEQIQSITNTTNEKLRTILSDEELRRVQRLIQPFRGGDFFQRVPLFDDPASRR